MAEHDNLQIIDLKKAALYDCLVRLDFQKAEQVNVQLFRAQSGQSDADAVLIKFPLQIVESDFEVENQSVEGGESQRWQFAQI